MATETPPTPPAGHRQLSPWQHRMHEIIFEADTRAGKAFDVALLVAIVLSVAAVMLDSVASFHARYGRLLLAAEWIFTILFTIEYVLRLLCVGRPLRRHGARQDQQTDGARACGPLQYLNTHLLLLFGPWCAARLFSKGAP